MKFNSFFASIILCSFFFFGSAVQAQTTAQSSKSLTEEACEGCQPSISSINAYDFPGNCNVKAFAAVMGGYSLPFCPDLNYSWSTIPSTNVSILEVGGHAKITFGNPGIYQVCLRAYRIISGVECYDEMCIPVSVCP